MFHTHIKRVIITVLGILAFSVLESRLLIVWVMKVQMDSLKATSMSRASGLRKEFCESMARSLGGGHGRNCGI